MNTARILTLAIAIAGASTAPAAAQLIDFETLTLNSGNSLPATNSTDPTGRYNNGYNLSGSFTAGGATFNNTYSEFVDPEFGTFISWAGWAYANVRDVTTQLFTTQTNDSQYAAYNNVGTGTPGGGVGNAGNFALGFVDFFTPTLPEIVLPSGTQAMSAYFTNNTVAAVSMLNGDGFALPFSAANNDFLLLTITGYNASNVVTGTVDYYLAGYGSHSNAGVDFIVDDWTLVDLSGVGAATRLTFDVTTSDVGMFGPNTPLYFAMDNLQLQVTAVPEPGTLLLTTISAFGLGWRARRRLGLSQADA